MLVAEDVEQRLRSKYHELALKELKLLREELIGSPALLVHVRSLTQDGGGPLELKKCALGDTAEYGVDGALTSLGEYLFEMTVGCVALVHKGCWPEAGSTAKAGGASKAKPNWNLFKEALAATESFVEILRKSKPDWSVFLAVIAAGRENGRIKDDDRWSVSKTQAALNEINEAFVSLVEPASEDFDASYFLFKCAADGVLMKALESVPTLPASKCVDPFTEDVRARGQWVIEEVARAIRNEGNELFKQGMALTGEAQSKAWDEAEKKYTQAVCNTEEDAITNTNLAALYLSMKRYIDAIGAAQETQVYNDFIEAPLRFPAKRAWVKFKLIGLDLEDYEDEDYDRSPLLRPYDSDGILFKAYIRSARAHAALFEAGIKGENREKDDEDGPWCHLCEAHSDYQEALSYAGKDESVVPKELKKLQRVYQWALKADDGTHDKAEYEDELAELEW